MRNKGCGALRLGRVYKVIPDRAAKAEQLVRVVDDSGEDYLYPADYFRLMRVPAAFVKQLEKEER
jgi:hypothetical protein